MKRLSLILILLCGTAQAQDEPRAMLRTRLEPAGPVLVGQPVRLQVDVLVTTWLTGAPVFPQFDMDGALVVLPEEQPVNLTERIDGRSWFGLTRSYLIYPQEPTEYQTPPATVIVRYGQAKEPARLTLTQHTFRARVPAEAQGLGYFIATEDLRMEQRLEPGPGDFRQGDAIKRTITMTADKTYAMFLPPVKFEPREGLALYPDPPRLEDKSGDRIGFQGGQRTDSATYVIQKEGSFELPAIEVFWWDLKSDRMREAVAPSVAFEAAPNPDFAPDIPLPAEAEQDEAAAAEAEKTWVDAAKRWSIPAIAALAVLLLLIRYLPGLVRRYRKNVLERRLRYEKSSAAAFEQLRRAGLDGNARNFVRSLYVWLDRIAPPGKIATLKDLALHTGDESLLSDVEKIEAGSFGKESQANGKSEVRRLFSKLERLQKGILQASGKDRPQTKKLPDLNPGQTVSD